MQPQPRRDDKIPEIGSSFHVRRLKANEKFRGILLGPIQGYWCHWDGRARRTLPCMEPDAHCLGHQQQLPLKWKGYYCALNTENRVQEFLEVTNRVAMQIKWLLVDRGSERGKMVTIVRGKGNHTRCSVTIEESYFTDTRMPKDVDVLRTLQKLWGISGAEQPLTRDDDIPDEVVE